MRLSGLLLLGVLACGCSSLLARRTGTDLSVLRPGASRFDVELELGDCRDERLLPDGGVVATYGCVVVTGRDRRRHERHRDVHRQFRRALKNPPEIAGDDGKPLKLAWWAVVGAAWIVTDGVMATGEVVHRRRQRRAVEVTYDPHGRVVRHEVE